MQHCANVVLDYISRLEEEKRKIRELKLALVTAQILSPFDAFPEMKPMDDEEDGFPDETDQVTYIFSEAPEDVESIEDELRSLLAASAQGTATFDDGEDWG